MYSPVTKSPKLGKYSPATTKSRARTRSGGASTSEYAPLEVQSAGYGGTDGGAVATATPSKMMIVAPVVISQFFERLAFYGLQVGGLSLRRAAPRRAADPVSRCQHRPAARSIGCTRLL
mmetsp:Transcript_28633/g.77061  ORF Transcript_28633/g.77061 Transcript_28633/m.77061 type:complete len:119 (+) Transcript_28633:686-1042(+)